MNRKTIITTMFALVAMAGQAQETTGRVMLTDSIAIRSRVWRCNLSLEKAQINLAFCSLIRNSDLKVEDRLHLGNTKKIVFFFGISLDLRYLCRRIIIKLMKKLMLAVACVLAIAGCKQKQVFLSPRADRSPT